MRRRGHLGSEADRATFRALHQASLASPALREGLTADSAERAIKHLRTLLGTPALALTGSATTLAWDGSGGHHEPQAGALAAMLLAPTGHESGRGWTRTVEPEQLPCRTAGCPVRTGVISPLVVDDRVVGTIQAYAPAITAGLIRATEEVAQWVSSQLELAELDASRNRAIEAEVQALRAQISPHFIYNSLGAIASFVRTDPDRARELLLEFADFTRYSFRRHGEFTTLAEELRSIERYLLLEQARFGDRLQVTLNIAPEVLPVVVPFLCIQPLVENAVRHGLESSATVGHLRIVAHDRGHECVVEVEDDGVGEDPEKVRRALAGDAALDSVGLGNVDARLRATFGDDYGLVVETAPGAGTKVIVRVPKFAPGRERAMTGLRVLVVDDEQPALDELAFLLDADDRIAQVVTAVTATEGLRILRETDVDAVFLDIQMPGLSGLELAEVLGRFKEPPPVVFVTAHEEHAVDAFELHAVDYVLKPVRADRLAEAVRRVLTGGGRRSAPEDTQIAVERGGVTRFIDRGAISYVEAHGDYARLHTRTGDAYLVRIPLSTLEDDWRSAGFHRIHRSLLVALAHIDELRTDAGRCTVLVGEAELPVARRHTRELRDVLVRRARDS